MQDYYGLLYLILLRLKTSLFKSYFLCLQIVACIATAALAGPVPQNRYVIRRPQNGVSLHGTARDLNRGQTFRVELDSREDSREGILNLQGVGNFANRQAQPVQRTNLGGRSQFRLEVDDDDHFDDDHFDDSLESDEIFFSSAPCPAGQLRHGNRCVVPRINRNIFVFGREDQPEQKSIDPASIPLPQLDYNIIFVRSKPARARRPVIVPPPQKKTVVYVLEDEEEGAEGVIEAPVFPDADPEVYYVKVRDGENPQLPGGLDLKTAYSQAIRPLQDDDDSFESSIELTLGAGGLGGAGFRQQSSLGSVGVPLAEAQPQAQFNDAGAGFADPGFNGGGGFIDDDPQLAAPGGLGVPLPSFQGNADFAAGGRSVNSRDQSFAAARNLEVEFDDGRLEVEPADIEVVRPALRYEIPQ